MAHGKHEDTKLFDTGGAPSDDRDGDTELFGEACGSPAGPPAAGRTLPRAVEESAQVCPRIPSRVWADMVDDVDNCLASPGSSSDALLRDTVPDAEQSGELEEAPVHGTGRQRHCPNPGPSSLELLPSGSQENARMIFSVSIDSSLRQTHGLCSS